MAERHTEQRQESREEVTPSAERIEPRAGRSSSLERAPRGTAMSRPELPTPFSFMRRFIEAPRPGEVYNLGGGRDNSISILEAFDLISAISGKQMNFEYVDQNRAGDHICYISNLDKMKAHYPGWGITKDLETTFQEIHDAWLHRSEAK